MRQGSHSKRNRGRGGNRRSGTPGRNHTFDSNGPDIRIRGNAHQVHEKYMNLAREASTNGEAVPAESYFQHAEHYYRILSKFTDEANNEQNKNQPINLAPVKTTITISKKRRLLSRRQKMERKTFSNNGAVTTDESAAVLEPEEKEPKDDLLSLNGGEPTEESVQQEEPALALRSDERLNIDLAGEGDQSTKASSSRLRLENTEGTDEASNLRRRRGPRNTRQSNSVDN